MKIVAKAFGIEVPDAPHLGPKMLESIDAERFEKNEIRAGLAKFKPGSRMLELGAGSGFVGAVLAKNCKLDAVLSIEANPNLIEHIKELHAHNGLSDVIEVRHGVVFSEPDAPDEIDFFVRGNFLGSALKVLKKPEKAVKHSVSVLSYDMLKEEFPHNVIMMDIEGGEREFLCHADLSGVDTVILEVHRDIYGKEGMQEVRQSFATAGMVLDEETSKPGVHVYVRTYASDQS